MASPTGHHATTRHPEARHIVFVGAMGSGKSTIGVRVAAVLGRPFLDNDAELERTSGSSAAQLAACDGIESLHRSEACVVLDALGAPEAAVISAAASTITDAGVRNALKGASFVVWLRAGADALVARMPGSADRPVLDQDLARLARDQSEQRDPLFAEIADATFETDGADVDTVVGRVLAAFAHEAPGS